MASTPRLRPIDIGAVRIEDPVILAPMSGVTDMPFRQMVKRGGAGLVLTSVLMSLLVLVAVAYAFYQYRARRFMDAEIRNIMSQYMPLDQEPMDDGAYEQPPRTPREDPHGRILPMSVPLSDKF